MDKNSHLGRGENMKPQGYFWLFMLLLVVIGAIGVVGSYSDSVYHYKPLYASYLAVNPVPTNLDEGLKTVTNVIGKNGHWEGALFDMHDKYKVGYANWFIDANVKIDQCTSDLDKARPFGEISFNITDSDGIITSVNSRSTDGLTWTRSGMYDFTTVLDLESVRVEFLIDVDELDCLDTYKAIKVYLK